MQQIRGKKSPTKSPPSYCHQIYFVLSLQSAAPKNTQLPSQSPRPHRREAPFPAGPGGRPPPHNEFAAAAREGCAAAPPGSGRRSLGEEADPEAGESRAGRGGGSSVPHLQPHPAGPQLRARGRRAARIGATDRTALRCFPLTQTFDLRRENHLPVKHPERLECRTESQKTCRCHPIASPHPTSRRGSAAGSGRC